MLDMVLAFSQASGKDIPYQIVERRSGDISACYADPALAKSEIGWIAEKGINAMCEDTWKWQSENPDGY